MLNDNNDNGFAVVELFTSEGCSSCPPADQLLAKLARQKTPQNLFLLSYHVDYWDYLGWKDPFSSAAFTDRQRWYAAKFASSRIYTPQMIVNGTEAFVGSREDIALTQIAAAMRQTVAATLRLKIIDHREEKVFLAAQTTNDIPSGTILLVVVQKSAETVVLRGENRGEKLQHVNIVRDMQQSPANANQETTIMLPRPSEVQPEQLQIMGFLQNEKNGAILAATVIEWPR